MKRRTQDRLITGGAIVLALIVWGVTLAVLIVLGRAMFHAAERGDTAMTVAYGVILLVVCLSMRTGRSK